MKYEEAIERLQTIVADIERGETNVDELAESLKEAKSLIAFCKEKLQLCSDLVYAYVRDNNFRTIKKQWRKPS